MILVSHGSGGITQAKILREHNGGFLFPFSLSCLPLALTVYYKQTVLLLSLSAFVQHMIFMLSLTRLQVTHHSVAPSDQLCLGLSLSLSFYSVITFKLKPPFPSPF